MRRLLVLLWIVLLVCSGPEPVRADLAASPLIEAGFELLEEGNPFVRRYGEITGREVKALFPLGVPYFFGGRSGWGLWEHYPDYTLWKCLQASDYYKVGQFYIYGLDCTGFTQHINTRCGRPRHDSLSNMLAGWEGRRPEHLYDGDKPMPPFPELKNTLLPGDFLVLRHENAHYRHIAMYIGTLRDFGYTAEQEPALAEYLDFPLVIHCGNSPVYGARFQALIDSDPRFQYAQTTDGGVQISLVGVPAEAVPEHAHVQRTDYDYFTMQDGGYVLTVISMEHLAAFCWFRQM